MKTLRFVALVLIPLAFVACTSASEEMTKIRELEKQLSAVNGPFDTMKVRELIVKYDDFADDFPDDSMAPYCLLNAAGLSNTMMQGEKAIAYYDQLIAAYPDHKKAADAYFLKAYVYENTLQDLEKAKETYRDFIQKYPKHELADDAEISMRNVGKSPEQLLLEMLKIRDEARPDSAMVN